MSLPPEGVAREVEAALTSTLGRRTRVGGWASIGGGCVNPSVRLQTDAGAEFFLKWNRDAAADLFAAEADGLEALSRGARGTGLRIPGVMAVGEGVGGVPPWLLLELIERGRTGASYAEALGAGLASLHLPGEGAVPGWRRDNYIGPLPQGNDSSDGWAGFWRDRRLAPQIALARDGGLAAEDAELLDRVLDRVPDALADAEADGSSLLHGDLWSGNVYPGPSGEPVLIDPAVYRGHGEVDLAMAELFGGFPAGFRPAYDEARPPLPGRDRRRPLYQLYYLLVHVNLFGSSYLSGTRDAARRVLAAT